MLTRGPIMLLLVFSRDISPNNIVAAGGRGLLIDFHVSCQTGNTDYGLPHASGITGKPWYRAVSLRHPTTTEGHSAATDLESLFYTLLDVASDGLAVRWRHAQGPFMEDSKLASMTDPVLWTAHVKARCAPELHTAIQELHDLFFPGGGAYVKDVSVAAFLNVLHSHTAV
jgi:Fungal protein kinase